MPEQARFSSPREVDREAVDFLGQHEAEDEGTLIPTLKLQNLLFPCFFSNSSRCAGQKGNQRTRMPTPES